jgi:hypothetical protein
VLLAMVFYLPLSLLHIPCKTVKLEVESMFVFIYSHHPATHPQLKNVPFWASILSATSSFPVSNQLFKFN